MLCWFDEIYLSIAGASAVSGFFASACSLPFDYVKTQIQKMQPDAEGKYPSSGSLACAINIESRRTIEILYWLSRLFC